MDEGFAGPGAGADEGVGGRGSIIARGRVIIGLAMRRTLEVPEALRLLEDFHQQALRALRSVIVAFVSDNVEVARLVMGMKEELKLSEERARQRQAMLLGQKSLVGKTGDYVVLMDIMENLKRIYYHTKRIAKQITRHDRETDAA